MNRRFFSMAGTFVLALAGSFAFGQGTPSAACAAPLAQSEATAAVLRAYTTDHAPSFFSDDAIFVDLTRAREPLRGRAAISAYLDVFYRGAFQDVRVERVSEVTCGDTAVLEFVFHGVHSGPQLGFPATGKAVSLPLIATYRLRDGKIVSARLYYDSADLPRQLGLAR